MLPPFSFYAPIICEAGNQIIRGNHLDSDLRFDSPHPGLRTSRGVKSHCCQSISDGS